MKKVQDAVPLRNDHIVALEELESTMSQDSLVQWRTAVELWENDSTAPNPFKATRRSTIIQNMALYVYLTRQFQQ